MEILKWGNMFIQIWTTRPVGMYWLLEWPPAIVKLLKSQKSPMGSDAQLA